MHITHSFVQNFFPLLWYTACHQVQLHESTTLFSNVFSVDERGYKSIDGNVHYRVLFCTYSGVYLINNLCILNEEYEV